MLVRGALFFSLLFFGFVMVNWGTWTQKISLEQTEFATHRGFRDARGEGAEVVPIVLPADTKSGTPQQAARIGHLLGKGSIALIDQTGVLSILSPAGAMVAKGKLSTEAGIADSWSPAGNVLLYRVGQNILRMIDFGLGEDRLLVEQPSGMVVTGPFMWAPNGDSLYFHTYPYPEGPVSIWSIGVKTRIIQRFKPVPANAEDMRYLEWMDMTDIAPNGGAILVTGTKYSTEKGIESQVVYLIDAVSGRIQRRLSSAGGVCSGARFSPSGEHIAYVCTEPWHDNGRIRAVNNIYITSLKDGRGRRITNADPPGYLLWQFFDNERLLVSSSFTGPGFSKKISLLTAADGKETLLYSSSEGAGVVGIRDGKVLLLDRRIGNLREIELGADGSVVSKIVAKQVLDAFVAQ